MMEPRDGDSGRDVVNTVLVEMDVCGAEGEEPHIRGAWFTSLCSHVPTIRK